MTAAAAPHGVEASARPRSPARHVPHELRQTIHEMREMRALAMGQYGHNNQPSHHVLWLLGLLGYAATRTA